MFSKFFSASASAATGAVTGAAPAPATNAGASTTTGASPATASTPAKAPERPLPVIAPPVDIREDAARVIVEADLPGVPQSGIEITVHRGVLTLRGTPTDYTPNGCRTLVRDFGPVIYERTFTLADVIDETKVSAETSLGVLRIVLPKRPETRPRTIAVSG